MKAEVRSSISLLIGVVTLRVATSGLMLNYVKLGMRPWLLASGAVLCFLGVIGFLRATRAGGDHEHDHPPSKAAWLLILPVLAASLMTPQALGTFAADRQSNVRAEPDADWPPLPEPTNGAVEMGLWEFTDRAFTDKNRSLEGTTVRLIGFVSPAEAGSDASFLLTRFAIQCCAADARALQVEIHGKPGPRAESWVEVTGEWIESESPDEDAFALPALQAKTLVPTKQPKVPYE